AGGAGTCTAAHSYTAAGNYTITFTVTDNAGAGATATVGVSITPPPAPTLTPPANQTGSEGSAKTFSLGSFAGGVGPYTVSVTWGDGTSSCFSASAGSLSRAHTPSHEAT